MKNIITNYIIFECSENTLGEGLYVYGDGVYWLDIIESKLFVKIKDNVLLEFLLPEQASSIWKVESQIVYVASESGICTFNLKTNDWFVYAAIPPQDNSPTMRANDGAKIDDDRYFFGTMEKIPSGENGALYVYANKTLSKVYDGIGIPNSFIRVDIYSFLVSDSLNKLIYRFTFNTRFDAIEKQELWLDLSNADYTPDGGCNDEYGNIYLAMWNGACVNKYDENANLIVTYPLPALNPTNCKLSLDGNALFVTSARQGVSKNDLIKYPSSGSLFEIGIL